MQVKLNYHNYDEISKRSKYKIKRNIRDTMIERQNMTMNYIL